MIRFQDGAMQWFNYFEPGGCGTDGHGRPSCGLCAGLGRAVTFAAAILFTLISSPLPADEPESETEPVDVQLTKEWTTLFLIRTGGQPQQIIPAEFAAINPKPFELEGPHPKEPNLLGNYKVAGRYVLQDGTIRRGGDDNAVLMLPSADAFELEGIAQIETIGGWLMLLGWDEETRSGYCLYHVQLRVSGAPWHLCEFKDGKVVEGTDRELIRKEVAGEGAFRVSVTDKKVSVMLADKAIFKALPLPNYTPGRVMVGTYNTGYGAKDISFRSLRMRAR